MQNITFITNVAKNNLEYTKLLLRSLEENLDNKQHQIIIFVDTDNENSLEYLLSIQKNFHDLTIIHNTTEIPIGYQRNKTLLTQYAKYDIVSYLQSDMVVGPQYDTDILQHVKRGRILSATRVEPPLHGESAVTVTKDFGLHPEDFDMSKWNTFSQSIKKDELISYFFAPITYYKDDWMKLGGYDTVFRRSREDSDFVQRCVHANIELVQTLSANVYHFTCVSSRGKNWFDKSDVKAQERVKLQTIADNIELRKFIRKWGNFNHGEKPLVKLDADLVVKNYELQAAYELEPFFTRIWLSSEHDRNVLVSEYNQFDNIANILWDISNETWGEYKYLYRTETFDNIFHVGEPTEYSTKIVIDFSKIKTPNQFLSNIQNMYDLLKDCEAGQYELDGVEITVKSIQTIIPPLVVENPPFNFNLLKVYE